MVENLIVILLFLALNSAIYFNFSKLISIVNIYDTPDNIRKIHSGKVAIIGGTIIYLNLCLVAIIKLINPEIEFFQTNLINSNRNFISFFSISTAIFLIGLYDDKYGIRATKKLFLCAFIILITLQINPDLQIKVLNFSFYNEEIYLYEFSLIFTIICFLLFINALNMFDGINLQVGIYCMTVLLFFYFHNLSVLFSICLVIALLFFLLLNYSNKCFLGDSGCYLLSFLISIIIIHHYNLQFQYKNEIEFIYVDDIFLLLMIPGLDMFRLFISRLAQGKNPFVGDNNHLHHLLLERFGLYKTNIIVQSVVIIPLILMNIFGTLIIILLSAITYLLLVYFMYRRV